MPVPALYAWLWSSEARLAQTFVVRKENKRLSLFVDDIEEHIEKSKRNL